jgi:hypothetical protein
MRLILLAIVLLASSLSLTAQQVHEWERVYTFDDSFIDINTSLMTVVSEDVTRVRFRWTFDHPETLSGNPRLKYNSQLEVMELNCATRRYRSYHLTFYDAAGNIIRIEDSPRPWSVVESGSMTEKLFAPACDLIKKRMHPEMVSAIQLEQEESIRVQNAAKYAYRFAQQLEQTKDFAPLMDEFFVQDFLSGYLNDKRTNWFLNLDRDTAAKLTRRDLRRFYLASMNAAYLSSLYLISQAPLDSDEMPVSERLVPPDVRRMIRNHPYTTKYKRNEDNYDFLVEKIGDVERLRIYTDLLERLVVLMRKHVIRVDAEHSRAYKEMLKDWELYEPKARSCRRDCLGLPTGTRVFDVNVPIFQLQLAEIGGTLKVVSAINSFQ